MQVGPVIVFDALVDRCKRDETHEVIASLAFPDRSSLLLERATVYARQHIGTGSQVVLTQTLANRFD